MLERPEFPRSNRTLSASSLKDRLSKLSVTPLRPVAALQARVKCVHSTLSLFGYLAFSALNPYFPPCLQLCPSEHSSGPQTPDHLGRTMDQHDSHLHLPHPLPPVRPFLRGFDPQLMCDGVGAGHI